MQNGKNLARTNMDALKLIVSMWTQFHKTRTSLRKSLLLLRFRPFLFLINRFFILDNNKIFRKSFKKMNKTKQCRFILA